MARGCEARMRARATRCCLSAGELRGIALLQRHRSRKRSVSCSASSLAPGFVRARAVRMPQRMFCCDRHVREERVLLEQHTRTPRRCGREVDAAVRCQRASRRRERCGRGRAAHDARDALERHALAAAGRAEQRQSPRAQPRTATLQRGTSPRRFSMIDKDRHHAAHLLPAAGGGAQTLPLQHVHRRAARPTEMREVDAAPTSAPEHRRC